MGQAATEILVSLGAEVYGLDVKSTTTSGAKSLEVDLRDRSAIEQPVAAAGTDVLGVFNCAGLPGPPFSDLDVMIVNFVGGRHLIESMIPNMASNGAACFVASNAGLGWQQELATLMPLVTSDGFDAGKAWREANPSIYAGNGYVVSKKVINAWVAWRAASLIGEGKRLNNINPGPTTTAMMPFFEEANGAALIDAFIGPIGRRSTAAEQAWPMVMLNSPHMPYVNGEALHTDGGFLGAMVTGQIDLSAIPCPAEVTPTDKQTLQLSAWRPGVVTAGRRPAS